MALEAELPAFLQSFLQFGDYFIECRTIGQRIDRCLELLSKGECVEGLLRRNGGDPLRARRITGVVFLTVGLYYVLVYLVGWQI